MSTTPGRETTGRCGQRPPFQIALRRGAAAEDGAMTALGLTLMIGILVLGGLAMDVMHLIEARTQLQVTTDLTAHAALYARDSDTAENAKAKAMALAAYGMPDASFGTILTADDIVFGHWDRASQQFTPDPASKDAVLVSTGRDQDRSNPVSSYLLKLIGYDTFDLSARAIFTTYRPTCFTEGFVADGMVDIQSNNSYFNGFCIHSNDHVSINSNNYWDTGTVVSMPDLGLLDLPQSGFETNLGLQAALREGYYRMRLINKLPAIIENLGTWQNEWQPDYIDNIASVTLTGTKMTPDDVTPGRIHHKDCGNSGKLTLDAGIYSNFVLVTDCQVVLSNGVILEDVLIATSNTGAKSVTGPQGAQIGRDDNCAEGGGAQILTLGGIDFAANLGMFGGQMVATGDISFSARADGLQGASIVSGGTISGTSNMSMALCGTGMEDNIEANYFRLAY